MCTERVMKLNKGLARLAEESIAASEEYKLDVLSEKVSAFLDSDEAKRRRQAQMKLIETVLAAVTGAVLGWALACVMGW